MTSSRRLSWWDDAACLGHGPGIFFPGPGEGNGRVVEVDYLVGKTFCAVCPVRRKCLDFAVENRIDDGLWGGLSPRDRAERGL